MASTQQEIHDQVRDITDYDTSIIADADLDDIINLAEDEIKSDLDDPTMSFYQGNDTFHIDLAVMWLASLFAKVKTGEIEGPTLSLGELRSASLTGSSSIWLERFERRLHASGDAPGFGAATISRTGREYGESF